MSYEIVRAQQTPNPNAIKFVVDRPITDRPRSYFAAEEAREDPLGSALFAIPGVTNLLFNDDWVTVVKQPDVTWPAVKSAVERILKNA